MIINHNMNAMNAHRNMSTNTVSAGKSMEKLSSGLRINKAGDDAAGLAVSEKMRGQIRGLDQASRNGQDGISMIQTAEGALNETHSILQRMRELSVQSSTDTNTIEDRAQIQKEIDQLTSEVDRIGNNTEFNTKKLINGNLASGVATAQATVMTGNVVLKVSGGALAASGLSIQALADANGNVFGIANNDTITITGKKGTTYVSTTFTVGAATTLADLFSAISVAFGAASVNIDATGNLHVTGAVGASNDIGGITITVKDSSNNVRNAATEKLSALAKSQDAADVRSDGTNEIFIGANQGQQLDINFSDMRASALGINGLKVETQSQANISITIIDNAIKEVSTERSKLGAYQNRLEHTIANLNTSSENLQSSESRVRDVDMAKEMMTFSKNNILSQAAQAMLAQANQQPQGVLQLLR
jgi:flagellin